MSFQRDHNMALGMTLGRLGAQSERQVDLLLATLEGQKEMNRKIDELPDKLAGKVPACRAPTTSRPMNPRETVMALLALVGLALLVAGKITWADFLPILRTLVLGMP